MTINEIKQAVVELSPEELARFRAWFEEFDAKAWDAQFERDAKAGRLDRHAAQAISEHEAGKSKPL